MKYLISEEQNRLLNEELEQPNFERLIKKLFEKQVSRGEQPHIDKMIMDFFEVDVWEREFIIMIRILKNFLGNFEGSVLEQAEGIVNTTISVYNIILNELRPTPASLHAASAALITAHAGLVQPPARMLLAELHRQAAAAASRSPLLSPSRAPR
jgi:hypothetical protein